MKIRDHIHNLSEDNPENIKAFNATYEMIDKLAKKITTIETIAFNITDEDMKFQLEQINAQHLSEDIINLVNYVIEHYRKKPRV
jgi:hypothetical protein